MTVRFTTEEESSISPSERDAEALEEVTDSTQLNYETNWPPLRNCFAPVQNGFTGNHFASKCFPVEILFRSGNLSFQFEISWFSI